MWGVGAQWLEPCVGSGAIVRAVESWQRCEPRRPKWSLCDIDPRVDDACVVTADYLDMQFPQRFNVAITNPPFNLAMGIVEAMREDATFVIILQRLNWLGSEGRAGYFRANMPDVFILPNRPAFMLNAAGQPVTDNCDYAWFAWGLTEGGHVAMLGDTPAEVRQCQSAEEVSRASCSPLLIWP
jgi:hypothetical protein